MGMISEVPIQNISLADLFVSKGRIVHLKKNTLLVDTDSLDKNIYMVKKGKMRMVKPSLDGKEFCLAILSEEEVFGNFSFFDTDSTSNFHAVSYENSELYVLNHSLIRKLILEGGSIVSEIFKLMDLQNKRIESKLRDYVLYGKIGAVYSTLIRLSNTYGVMQKDGVLIDYHLTNGEIGQFSGTSRESVNRMLMDLRNKGVISIVDGGKLFIHDLEFLRNELCCDNCPMEVCTIF